MIIRKEQVMDSIFGSRDTGSKFMKANVGLEGNYMTTTTGVKKIMREDTEDPQSALGYNNEVNIEVAKNGFKVDVDNKQFHEQQPLAKDVSESTRGHI